MPERRVRGYIWGCGDEYCDCTQARIGAQVRTRTGYITWVDFWTGRFHTDGNYAAASMELKAVEVTAKVAGWNIDFA